MRPTPPNRRPVTLATALAGAAVGLTVLAGCSAGDTSSASGGASSSLTQEAPAGSAGSAATLQDKAATSAQSTRGAVGDTGAVDPAAALRKVTRHADLSLRVTDLAAAASRIRAAATAAGGLVVAEQVSSDPTPTPTARPLDDTTGSGAETTRSTGSGTVTVSVPAARLDATLDELAKVGTVLSRETGTDDVTGTYVDTQSRVASMQASVARVRALMGRATKLSDIVSLEGELSRREADLEALQTQLATLKDAVALSPVTVHLTTDVAPVPEPAPTGFVAGLTAGWRAFTSSVTVVLTGLGALLPFAGLAALVGVPAVLWWRRRLRPVAEAAEGSPAAG